MTELEALLRERLALKEQAEHITARLKDVDAQIIAHAQVGDLLAIGDQPVARVTQRRTFSLDLAKEKLPAQIIEAATVTEPTVDVKQLKAMLAPALLDACMKPGSVYITAAS